MSLAQFSNSPVLQFFNSSIRQLLLLPIRLYQLFISPLLGVNCRFTPTCSCYAQEAIEKHGIVKGGFLTVKRLLRCHPFAKAGHDPVPPETMK